MHNSVYKLWIELVSLQNPRARLFAKFLAAMELEMLEPTSLFDILNGTVILRFSLPRFGLFLIVLNK